MTGKDDLSGQGRLSECPQNESASHDAAETSEQREGNLESSHPEVEKEKETEMKEHIEIREHEEEAKSSDKGLDEETRSKDQDDRGDTGVPIDRGWAWVIVFSTFITILVFNSIGQVVATLLTDILDEFDVSVSVISTTLSVGSLGRCLATMLAANVLLPRMSIRVMITSAAILNVAVTLAIVLLPNIIVFCAALIVKEFCKGFTIISALALVGHYFQRHRGLATAFSLIGFSVCAAVIPPFIRFVKDQVGFKNALLLYSGLEMQAIVVALLLRPISSYKRKEVPHSDDKFGKENLEENTEQRCADKLIIEHDKSGCHEDTKQGDMELEEKKSLLANDNKESAGIGQAGGDHPLSSSYLEVLNKDNSASHQKHVSSTSSLQSRAPSIDRSLHSSWLTLTDVKIIKSLTSLNEGSHHVADSNVITPAEDDNPTCCVVSERCSWMKELIQIFNPALFRDYVCLLVCTAYSLNICAQFVLIYLPTYAQTVGLSKPDSATLLTIAGISELLGRLFSGLLGDRRWLSPGIIIATSSLVICVVCQLAGLLRTFWMLAVFAAVIGHFGCFGQNLMSVLIVEVLGLDKLASVLAMGSLFGSLSFAAAHFIHGVLIETTGGFLASFSLTGIGFLVAAVLLLCLPLVKKLQSKKAAAEKGQVEENDAAI